jgi:hypothetical protein
MRSPLPSNVFVLFSEYEASAFSVSSYRIARQSAQGSAPTNVAGSSAIGFDGGGVTGDTSFAGGATGAGFGVGAGAGVGFGVAVGVVTGVGTGFGTDVGFGVGWFGWCGLGVGAGTGVDFRMIDLGRLG